LGFLMWEAFGRAKNYWRENAKGKGEKLWKGKC
jgi:hypothetical protein